MSQSATLYSSVKGQRFCRVLGNGDINESSHHQHNHTFQEGNLFKFSTALMPPYLELDQFNLEVDDGKGNRYLFCGPVLGAMEAFVRYRDCRLKFVEPAGSMDELMFQLYTA